MAVTIPEVLAAANAKDALRTFVAKIAALDTPPAGDAVKVIRDVKQDAERLLAALSLK